MSCSTCESTQEVNLTSHRLQVHCKGKDVEFWAYSWKCTNCLEMFDTCESLNANLAAIRKILGITIKKQ